MLKNIPSNIQFPSDLPVSQRANDIKQAIKKNQVTIICGETGSGKTTQLPKICLALGRGQKKNYWPYAASKNCSSLSSY